MPTASTLPVQRRPDRRDGTSRSCSMSRRHPLSTFTFDGSEPFLVTRARLAITDQAPVLDPDSFASAVELAAGALLNYWMQRDAWPPDVRPAAE